MLAFSSFLKYQDPDYTNCLAGYTVPYHYEKFLKLYCRNKIFIFQMQMPEDCTTATKSNWFSIRAWTPFGIIHSNTRKIIISWRCINFNGNWFDVNTLNIFFLFFLWFQMHFESKLLLVYIYAMFIRRSLHYRLFFNN